MPHTSSSQTFSIPSFNVAMEGPMGPMGPPGPPGPQGVQGVPGADASGDFLPLAGGTITGELHIAAPDPLWLTQPAPSVNGSVIHHAVAGVLDFDISMGWHDVGKVFFSVDRYTDAGVFQDSPLIIDKTLGRVELLGDPTIDNHAATKGYVDAAVAGGVAGDFLPLTGGTLTGNLGIGIAPSYPLSVSDNVSWELAVDSWGIDHAAFSDIPTNAGYFYADRSRGTRSAQTSVVIGDTLGGFSFNAFEGTNWQNACGIYAEVDAAVSAGVVPSAFYFMAGTSGGGTERLRISSNGKVTLTSPVAITDANQIATKAYVDSLAGGAPAWADITGKPTTFPPTVPIAWADISGEPATYPPDAHSHAYADITGKPATFAPSTHSHPQSEVTNLVTDLGLKAPLASPAFTGTPTGITKTHVGLSNVDNTTDAGKPVSTATQTALNAKAPLATISTGAPSGGVDGDVWYQVV